MLCLNLKNIPDILNSFSNRKFEDALSHYTKLASLLYPKAVRRTLYSHLLIDVFQAAA